MPSGTPADAASKPSSQPALRREAGLWQLVAYGVGNIIGAGIYVLIGEASGHAGGLVWAAFLIGAFIALLTGLSYAELGAMYPRTASEYVYVGRAYGSRALSFLTQWTMLATEVVAISAVALGFGGYFHSLVGVPALPTAAVLVLLLGGLVLLGIKQSLRVNTVLSIVAIAGLIFVVAVWLLGPGPASRPVDTGFLTSPGGLTGVIVATTLVFFAYIGFDNIVNLAEEIREPERTIPRGLMLSLALSTVLYVLIGLAALGLASWRELSTSDAPLALAVAKVFGDAAFRVLAVAALLTTLNTCLVLMIASSRAVFGMARENVLPKAASRISGKSGAPYVATVAVVLAALAFLSFGSIGIVASITSFGSLLTFAMVNVALIHLRRVVPGRKRPFKAPYAIGWLPVTAVLGLVSCVAVMATFNWLTALLGLGLPLSGAAVYWLYTRSARPAAELPAERLHEPHETSDGALRP